MGKRRRRRRIKVRQGLKSYTPFKQPAPIEVIGFWTIKSNDITIISLHFKNGWYYLTKYIRETDILWVSEKYESKYMLIYEYERGLVKYSAVP